MIIEDGSPLRTCEDDNIIDYWSKIAAPSSPLRVKWYIAFGVEASFQMINDE